MLVVFDYGGCCVHSKGSIIAFHSLPQRVIPPPVQQTASDGNTVEYSNVVPCDLILDTVCSHNDRIRKCSHQTSQHGNA